MEEEIDIPSLSDSVESQAAFARLLGITPQAVSNHVKNGSINGETYLDWIQSYIQHLRAEAAGRPENGDAMKAAKIRETTAKARKTELEIQQLEGVLVHRDTVIEELEPAIEHIKTTLNAASSRLATTLSAQHGIPIDQQLFKNEFNTALRAIAAYSTDKP